ncbi:hypothetical protein BJ138DRAFT_973937, partial [Hygrophoropsis aurantiaca]
KKPSDAQINHCLAPLIDDLLEFWSPGVYFSKTALRPFGRSVLAALIPVVCDIMGARQVGGFTGHMAKLFCSFCYLRSDQIENFDMKKWPLRTAEKHRADAADWLAAKTIEERTRLLKQNGARHSELLRLPYWNPVQFTILDTMHAHFLRMILEHIRRIWGVNLSGSSGEGLASPTTAPPRDPSNDGLVKALNQLKKTSDDESSAERMSSISRPVWKDQGRLELPSFLSPLPWQFGHETRKLSADQWRSVGMIHLVVTLIRLWGFDGGRKGLMLFNFMHLVTAIHIANMRTMSPALANYYTYHCKLYLEGLLSLYKEAKIQPTHHLSLHLESLLVELGPVHSWRAWAFERFNYMLQKTKTNLRFG